MTLIIVLYAFAIWYATFALTELDGPGGVFRKLRTRFDSDYSPLSCFYCTAFWVSVILCWVYGLGFFYIFALAGIASLINQVFERLE